MHVAQKWVALLGQRHCHRPQQAGQQDRDAGQEDDPANNYKDILSPQSLRGILAETKFVFEGEPPHMAESPFEGDRCDG